jgi:hypothetical protein
MVTTVISTLKHLEKLVSNYNVHSFRQMSVNMSNRRLLNSWFNLGNIKSNVNPGQGNEETRGWWWWWRFDAAVRIHIEKSLRRGTVLQNTTSVPNWPHALDPQKQISHSISIFYSLLTLLSSGSNSLRIAPFESKHYWSFSVFHCEGRVSHLLCSNHRNICAQDRAVPTNPPRQILCVSVGLFRKFTQSFIVLHFLI